MFCTALLGDRSLSRSIKSARRKPRQTESSVHLEIMRRLPGKPKATAVSHRIDDVAEHQLRKKHGLAILRGPRGDIGGSKLSNSSKQQQRFGLNDCRPIVDLVFSVKQYAVQQQSVQILLLMPP